MPAIATMPAIAAGLAPTSSLPAVEWEPGMSTQELGELLARLLQNGESRVVVQP